MILSQYEGDQLGSIKKVEAAYHTSFTSFNPAVFAGAASWQQIQFTEETGSLFLKVNGTSQGLLYKYSGGFGVPKLRDEAEDALLPLIGKVLILRITDMNDRIYIIGAPNIPVSLELDGETGNEFKNASGYRIAFSVEQTWKAFSL